MVIPVVSEDAGRAAARLWCAVPFVDVDSSVCSESEDRADVDDGALPSQNDVTQHASSFPLGGLDRPRLGSDKPTTRGKLAELARRLVATDEEGDPLVNPDVLGPHLAATESFAPDSEHVRVAHAAPALQPAPVFEPTPGGTGSGTGSGNGSGHNVIRFRDPSGTHGNSNDPREPRGSGWVQTAISWGAWLLRLGSAPGAWYGLDSWARDHVSDVVKGPPLLLDVPLNDDNHFSVEMHRGALRFSSTVDGVEHEERLLLLKENVDHVARRPGGPIVAIKRIHDDPKDNYWEFDFDELSPEIARRFIEQYPTPQDLAEDPGLVWDPENHPEPPDEWIGGLVYFTVGGVRYVFDPQTGEFRPVAFVGSSNADPYAARMAGTGGDSTTNGTSGNGQSDDDDRWRDGRYRVSVLPEGSDHDEDAKRRAAQLKAQQNARLRALWAGEPDNSLVLDLQPSETPGQLDAEAPPEHLSIDGMTGEARARFVESVRLMQDTYSSLPGTPIPGGVGAPNGDFVPYLRFDWGAYFGNEHGIVTATDPIGLAAVRSSIPDEPESAIRPHHRNPPSLSRRGSEVHKTFPTEDGGWEAATLHFAFTQALQHDPTLRSLVPPVEIATLDEEGNAILAMPHPGNSRRVFAQGRLKGEARQKARQFAGDVFTLARQAIGANEKGVRQLQNGATIAIDVDSLRFYEDGEPAEGWWLDPLKVRLGRPSTQTGLHEFPPNRDAVAYLAYPDSSIRDFVVEHMPGLQRRIHAFRRDPSIEVAKVRPGNESPPYVVQVQPFSNRDLLTIRDLTSTPLGASADPSVAAGPTRTAIQDQEAMRRLMAAEVGAVFSEAEDEYIVRMPDGKTYIVDVSTYFDALGNVRAVGPIQVLEIDLTDHAANVMPRPPGPDTPERADPTPAPATSEPQAEDVGVRFEQSIRHEPDGTALERELQEGRPVQSRIGPKAGLEAIATISDYLFEGQLHDLRTRLVVMDEGDDLWGSELRSELPDPGHWQTARSLGIEDVAEREDVRQLRAEWWQQLEKKSQDGPIRFEEHPRSGERLIWVEASDGSEVALRMAPIDEDHVWFNAANEMRAYPLFHVAEVDVPLAADQLRMPRATARLLPDGSALLLISESQGANTHVLARRTFPPPYPEGKALALATITNVAASAPDQLGEAIPRVEQVYGEPATLESTWTRDSRWRTIVSAEAINDFEAEATAQKSRERFANDVRAFLLEEHGIDVDAPESLVRINQDPRAYLYNEKWEVVKAIDLFLVSEPDDAAELDDPGEPPDDSDAVH